MYYQTFNEFHQVRTRQHFDRRLNRLAFNILRSGLSFNEWWRGCALPTILERHYSDGEELMQLLEAGGFGTSWNPFTGFGAWGGGGGGNAAAAPQGQGGAPAPMAGAAMPGSPPMMGQNAMADAGAGAQPQAPAGGDPNAALEQKYGQQIQAMKSEFIKGLGQVKQHLMQKFYKKGNTPQEQHAAQVIMSAIESMYRSAGAGAMQYKLNAGDNQLSQDQMGNMHQQHVNNMLQQALGMDPQKAAQRLQKDPQFKAKVQGILNKTTDPTLKMELRRLLSGDASLMKQAKGANQAAANAPWVQQGQLDQHKQGMMQKRQAAIDQLRAKDKAAAEDSGMPMLQMDDEEYEKHLPPHLQKANIDAMKTPGDMQSGFEPDTRGMNPAKAARVKKAHQEQMAKMQRQQAAASAPKPAKPAAPLSPEQAEEQRRRQLKKQVKAGKARAPMAASGAPTGVPANPMFPGAAYGAPAGAAAGFMSKEHFELFESLYHMAKRPKVFSW